MQNNNDKFSYLSLVLITAFLFAPTLSSAAIFKCINKKGDVYYNDKPCPTDNKETKLKNIKDPKNGYIPKPFIEKEKVFDTNKGVVVGKETQNKMDKKNKKKKNKDEKQASDISDAKTTNTNTNTNANANANAKGNNTKRPTLPPSFAKDNKTKIPTVNELRALSGLPPLKKNERYEPPANMEE